MILVLFMLKKPHAAENMFFQRWAKVLIVSQLKVFHFHTVKSWDLNKPFSI